MIKRFLHSADVHHCSICGKPFFVGLGATSTDDKFCSNMCKNAYFSGTSYNTYRSPRISWSIR